jgi:ribonucleotide monophosphatase NagD (HAD superfamily)
VLGKPSHAFYELAVKGLGLDAEDVAMIGDDAEADVGGTMAAALMGVLVQTGKYRPAAALPHASDKVSQARLSSLSENCFVTTSEASP